MAEFFDKVGAAMANMADKNKKMRNVNSMNAQIKASEKKIEEQFRQLGAAYYNQHGKNPDENLASYCNTIEEEYGKIVALRASINREKGIVVCEKCGTAVALGTNFCSYCGAPLPKEEVKVEVNEETLAETEAELADGENADAKAAEGAGAEAPDTVVEEKAEEPKEETITEEAASQELKPSEKENEPATSDHKSAEAEQKQETVEAPKTKAKAKKGKAAKTEAVAVDTSAKKEEAAADAEELSAKKKVAAAEETSGEAEDTSAKKVEATAETEKAQTADNAVSEEGVPLGDPCPFCGVHLRPNALFCIECGNKVK